MLVYATKIDNFRGHLTDVSAKTKTLANSELFKTTLYHGACNLSTKVTKIWLEKSPPKLAKC